jgi:putative endonuclease
LNVRHGRDIAGLAALDMRHIVYVINSESNPQRYYTGLTSDVDARLAAHNAGLSKHTASGRPWRVLVTIEFPDASRAVDFEENLKSGSGRAFAMRHFR